MNTQLPEQSTSRERARFRRMGFLVYPDCEILDVCGPFEAFFFADHWLGRLGRTAEPGYQSSCHGGRSRDPSGPCPGMEIVATHSYAEITDGLDTLVVAGGVRLRHRQARTRRLSNGCVRWRRGATRGVDLLRRVHGWRPLASCIGGA